MSQKFQVEGMSCQHCVQSVQNAVWTVDPKAQVTVDLRINANLPAPIDRPHQIAAWIQAGRSGRPVRGDGLHLP